MRKFLLSAAVLWALTMMSAGSASAIQLKYTGQAYSPSFGRYSIGAYSMKINPTGDSWASDSTNWDSQPTIAAVCDDFSGRISNGAVWEVTVHEMTVADLGAPAPQAKFWGNGVSDTTVTRDDDTINLVDYQAAAWLSDQLLTYHNNWSPTTADPARTRLQYAVWTIFNMSATTGLSGADITAITAYRQAAFDAVIQGQYTGAGWRVFTENPVTGTKQEMLVRVPEAASVASLGLNFGALALLGFVFRRRMK